MNLKSIFIILLCTIQISFAQITPKVNDGILLKDTQMPQVVVLSSEKGGVCTAELVGPRVLLTAAHCCEGGVVHPQNLSSTVKWEIHPDYRKITAPYYGFALPDIYVLENDLCAIQIASEVKEITPFSLPLVAPQIGSDHIIVGAGDPHAGNRQYGFMNVKKASDRGTQAQGTINYGRPGDSGGAFLSGNLGDRVTLVGVSSVSTYFCGEQGVIFTRDNKNRCADQASQEPSEVFVPAHTSGFVSLTNSENLLFLKNFEAKNKVEICGLSLKCPDVLFEQ